VPEPREAGEAPADGSILFVGSLEPVKDPALLVRAAARLPGVPSITFAGDGSLRPVLQRQVADLGLAERVRFLGHVRRSDLPERYRSAALLAVTSRHEGQSMAAVEAAACGVPVVGPRVGVVPDLGDGVLVVPPGDEDALTTALARVLDDPVLRATMASAARAAALRRFDIVRTSAALLADYDRLAAR
jgi:glycosyltransferase involved in cell wall biosynthesis